MSDGAEKAWGGRFDGGTHRLVEHMNASVGFDQKLALEDIAGSIAHSRMLLNQGILSADEQAKIEAGLVEINRSIQAGTFVFTVSREDVHMNIEGALTDAIGAVAGKLHSGRSRNDQVALDLRLYLRRHLSELASETAALVRVLLALSDEHAALPMPGYTHLQRAQPITFGHHLMAYAAMFLRDIERLLDARGRAAVLPLGSGALAGSPLPLDRWAVATTLEMDDITLNSLDGVSDRDSALETLSVLSIMMVHISRLAEEMVLWTSQEFSFVDLPDAFCTGSSLMPQKKNPDIPELLRGKSGRVFGALQTLLVVMKGLPLAYNKDMQEDKEPLFDALETVRNAVEILQPLLNAMTPRPAQMKQAMEDGFLLATDLADHLVDQGVPFRDAHHVVGRAVALCLERDVRLEDLSLSDLKSLHDAFNEDAVNELTMTHSLARRDLPGAPKPSRVLESIQRAGVKLDALQSRIAKGGPSALERALAADAPLPT